MGLRWIKTVRVGDTPFSRLHPWALTSCVPALATPTRVSSWALRGQAVEAHRRGSITLTMTGENGNHHTRVSWTRAHRLVRNCWRLWEALVPNDGQAVRKKCCLVTVITAFLTQVCFFFNSIGALKSRTYVIPSPLLSLAAGTEGPCRAASTGLYLLLLEMFLGRGRSVSLYWRG